MDRTCITCKYEPIWGFGKYKENWGECRWPCPPCLSKLLRPINKDKLFDCPAHISKEEIKC